MPGKKSKEAEELTFEQALEEIENIVCKLESGELPLEESLGIFQRGMELVTLCSGRLDLAEKKLKVLLESSDGSFSLKDDE